MFIFIICWTFWILCVECQVVFCFLFFLKKYWTFFCQVVKLLRNQPWLFWEYFCLFVFVFRCCLSGSSLDLPLRCEPSWVSIECLKSWLRTPIWMVGTQMSSSFAQTMRIASAEIFTFVLLPVSSWPSIQQEDQKDSYANFWSYFSAIFPAKASHLSLPQLLNIFLLNSVRPLLWLGPLTVLWSRNAYRQNAKENVGSTSFVSPLSEIKVLHCLMSNIHKQLFHIFLLVFLLFMVKSGPSYSNVQK